MTEIHTIRCYKDDCTTPTLMCDELYQQLRYNGRFWTCPSGHSQHFPKGPSEADKLRKEVAVLQRRIEEKGARLQHLENALEATRRLFIDALREPGIHYIGNYHHVWVCTCGRKGQGTMGEDNTRRLLAIHQERMHCNPLPGIEVKA